MNPGIAVRHRLPTLSFLLTVACAAAAPATTTVPRGPHPAPYLGERQLVSPATDTIEALLRTLTVRQKVGQLIMPWLLGDSVAMDDPAMQRIVRLIRDQEVGGIIMSRGTPRHIAWKVNTLQRLAPLPLLVSADFEGGTTLRMAAGTPFPTQMGIAAGGLVDDAYQMGRITGLEGRAVGVHLAFAPVADVNSNPNNPIINTRSFGGDAADVGRYVSAAVRGMRDGGILSTAKHFPGHGDTETDSHLALPTITAGWARFDTLELVPFRAAVDAGVDAIMSAHIALPALDGGAQRPGTLSPAILTGILRDSLGFTGMVTTDALDMGAIAKEIGPEEGTIRAFEAGSDLLLMPSDIDAAIRGMIGAVEDGRIPMARLDASVRRVLEFKARMGLFENRLVDESRVDEVISNPAFLALARQMAQRSVVLLKDSLGTVARLRSRPDTVALVAVADGNSRLGETLAADLRAAGHRVTLVRLPTAPSAAQRAAAERAIADAPVTILATAVRWGSYRGTIGLEPATATLLGDLAALQPTVLVSFGSPYVIGQVPAAASYLIGWAQTTMAEQAVADALGGEAPITGTAPIAIPPNFPIRSGIRLETAP